jgi:hypothetical protein
MVGDRLCLSGLLARYLNTGKIAGDPAAQVGLSLDRMRQTLVAASMDLYGLQKPGVHESLTWRTKFRQRGLSLRDDVAGDLKSDALPLRPVIPPAKSSGLVVARDCTTLFPAPR